MWDSSWGSTLLENNWKISILSSLYTMALAQHMSLSLLLSEEESGLYTNNVHKYFDVLDYETYSHRALGRDFKSYFFKQI